MKTKLWRSFLLVILLYPVSSLAQNGGFYIGGSFGSTDFDTEISAISSSLDEKDSGLKILFGKSFTKNAAIEVSYTDLGEASLSGNPGDLFGIEGSLFVFLQPGSLTLEGNAITVSGVFSGYVNEQASFFARLGLNMWDADLTFSGTNVSASLSEDGTDVYYGVGFQYDPVPSWGVRLEYEIYDLDDLDVTMLSVGAVFRF